jgi:hypothetical protein
MYKALIIVLALAVGCSPGSEESSLDCPRTFSYQFVNGRWYDGINFVDTTFYVSEGLLKTGQPSQVDSVIDLQGSFVVPPFGEAHTHRPSIPEFALDGINRFLDEGIFYVMNHGSLARYHPEFRKLTGHPTSIDAVFANALIASPLSHGVDLWQRLITRSAFSDVLATELDGDAYFIIESEDDLDRRWSEILATRPDFIKVMVEYSEEYDSRNGDRSYFGRSGLDPSLIPGIVARAHEVGLRVAAHIETAGDFRAVVESGVDIVAHLPGYDIALDDDLDRFRIDSTDAIRAGRQGTIVITTTMLSVDKADGDTTRLRRMQEVQRHNLRLLFEANVTIVAGSDQFSTNSVDEIINLESLEVFDRPTLLNMLSSATPRAIFPKRSIGILSDGADGSFLVLGGNPLEDLHAIREIRLRVKDGVLLEQS